MKKYVFLNILIYAMDPHAILEVMCGLRPLWPWLVDIFLEQASEVFVVPPMLAPLVKLRNPIVYL